MARRALITGVVGQDGTFLTDFLLGKGYEVFGVPGPLTDDVSAWTAARCGPVTMLAADLEDMDSLLTAVEEASPDEVYNFAAQSSVGESWRGAIATTETNAVGVLRLLEALRIVKPDARMFQASSAEMFGNAVEAPQRETTPLRPRSPYAASKTYGFHIVGSYRDSYGMHASSGILFNHESPLRGVQFVTRKITDAAARISLGMQTELLLGNLDARRDWGYAGDYIQAMWLMLQQDVADDYVIATGITHTVREFCEAAFARLDLDYERYVKVDPALFRPVDINAFWGDPTRAHAVLGWEPKVSFRGLVEMMVDADLERLRAG